MTKVDISNLSGLKFKIWLHVCSNLNSNEMMIMQNIMKSKIIENPANAKVKKHLLDTIYRNNTTTTIQSICDALPEYTKNHISKDLRWLVDKKLIKRHVADNNFKKGFYYASIDEVVFMHALATSLEKLKIKTWDKIDVHVSVADMQYVLYTLVCDVNNYKAALEMNIQSLNEYFTDIIFPLIGSDDTWKSKDNFEDIFHYKLESDDLPKLVLKLINIRKDYVSMLKHHFVKLNKDFKIRDSK